ncbi:MAG: hypothetical protein P8M11_03260, partial [Planctomycetota bacterium]|nr:hypothetical protein [Planctomycetota bacterium]
RRVHFGPRLRTSFMEMDTSPDPVNAEAPARRIECPQCGSKLPDIPVSLCPYCASPLETAADKRRLESVNASRIGRVVEHGTYESALAWDPPESSDWYDGARLAWWSGPVALIGLAALAWGVLVGSSEGHSFAEVLPVVLCLVGAASLLLSAKLRVDGKARQSAAVERPLLKRAALIVDRRSETDISGWSGRTTYFFKVEFEDGVVGEFRFPGLGAQEDPYATNLPGVAYTRGTDLLLFRHIRV